MTAVRRALAGAAVVLLIAAAAGCSSAAETTAPASAGGMMGEGGGMPVGAVAASENASIQTAPTGTAAGGLQVDRVLAPDDGWVVVRSSTPPGGVLGFAPVTRGENRAVRVPLTGADTVQVRVALFVDRGKRGAFEYDPEAPERSPDRAVIVSGTPLESSVRLSDWGVETFAYATVLEVEDQAIANGALRVNYLLLPEAGWISVNVIEDGLPGRRVGLLARSAGEWHTMSVPLDADTPPGSLAVTVFADRGTPGIFDHDPAAPYASADQPFISSMAIISKRITTQ